MNRALWALRLLFGRRLPRLQGQLRVGSRRPITLRLDGHGTLTPSGAPAAADYLERLARA